MKKLSISLLTLVVLLVACTTVDVADDMTGDDVLDLITMEEVEEAYASKYADVGIEVDAMEFEIATNENGMHAAGTVGSGPGGGNWFAANTDDGWAMVWDGNGSIDCASIESYDFPVDMIPTCWDYGTDELIER